MTKDGNIKFYDKNLLDSTCTYTFTSATSANAMFLYDNDTKTKLSSSGSTDLIPEVWIVEFTQTKSFNRVFIGGHNIKSGKVEYWNGSAYVDFSTPASLTANAIDGSLFEFNTVNTTKIKLTMNTTMIANSQKSVTELRVFRELGSVSMNPSKVKNEWPDASKEYATSNGGTVFVYFGEKFKTKLSFTKASAADVALFRSLKERGEPFYVYLCGGIDTYTEEFWRPSDMYFVIYTSEMTSELIGGLHAGIVKIDVTLKEV